MAPGAVRRPALLITVFLLALGAFASSASGALRHSVFTNEFGPDGTAGTDFGGGFRSVGFSQGNKRVMVAMENAVHSITVNSPGSYTPVGGLFPFSTTIGFVGDAAVSSGPGPTAGFIYTAPDSSIYRAWTAAGAEAGEFNVGGEVCGLAVDNAGNVWAGNWANNQIEEYPPGGSNSPILTISTSGIGRVCKLTVDPVTKDVYPLPYSSGPVYKLSASNGYSDAKQIFGTGDFFMDVNGAKHVLYLTDNSETIYAVDTNTGDILEEIKPGGAYRGVAVDESNDTLYAFAYSSGRVREIPLALVPKAVTGEPVGNSKVSGIVAPDGAGNITECFFEWGEEANNYTKPPVPCEGAMPITTEKTVTAVLPGTVNETTYHYRVVAKTATPGSVNFGLDEEITPHVVPALKTEAADEITRTTAKLHGSYDGNGVATEFKFEWGLASEPGFTDSSSFAPVPGGNPNTHTLLSFNATNLLAGKTYKFRVVGKVASGESFANVKEFTTLPAVQNLTTGPVSDLTPNSATLNGSFDIDALGGQTFCHFDYGADTSYGSSTPVFDAGSIPAAGEPASASIEVQEGLTYHFRLVCENDLGTAFGNDETFTTPQPPSIASVTSSNVTATTADLIARINPNGEETEYRFEYGTTTAYGQSIPIPDESIGAGSEPVQVVEHLQNLEVGATYHFRVVAHNKWGQVESEDQTFAFFTANCPNAHVRQQTGAAYLPDCRAYELVSPRNAGAVQLFPGQGIGGGVVGEDFFPFPPSPNLGFATNPSHFAFWGGIGQINGTDPPNILQDLYVSTRTPTGWETHYPGVAASETLFAGGTECTGDMNRCINYDLKDPLELSSFDKGSNAPYVYNSNEDSKPIGRFPTTVDEVEGGEEFIGDGKPSLDFSHFAFSSNNIAFAEEGLEVAPGSAYDNDTGADTTELISKMPDGSPIGQDAGGPDEFIRIPAVSRDGSHILMSTEAPNDTVHLIMRVGGGKGVSYDVAEEHGVSFVGMTPDGTKVYYTSDEPLTVDDEDTSVDLFMWEEATNSIKRLSAGAGEVGNTDSCSAGWTSQCDVQSAHMVIDTDSETPGQIFTGDNWISDSGDVYFYSPELLDGPANGQSNKRNLFVYRNGDVQFVAAFESGAPAARMQVTPDGDRVAFVTSTRILSGYDNSGLREMYTFDPDTEKMNCVSCVPTGAPPTSAVIAAANGIFMTDDGRTFFSTRDALVPFDSNGLRDVYEYVDGRPQLISSGTSSQDTWGGGLLIYPAMTVGLEGVSHDGTDVYFSTFDTLVSEDENGEFIKFYDARTGGGFPVQEPPPPCKAADECHNAGSVTPAPPPVGTGTYGTSGNVKSKPKKCKKGKVKKRGKCVKKKKKRRHRRRAR
jgi:hypothetical protein